MAIPSELDWHHHPLSLTLRAKLRTSWVHVLLVDSFAALSSAGVGKCSSEQYTSSQLDLPPLELVS
jgi:hypothetical protein